MKFLAIDPSGKIKPGWPVASAAAGRYWTDPQIASDSTLFILDKPDGSKAPASIAAFGPDGRSRAGWPVSVPDANDYRLGPNGTVIVRSLVDDTGELCTEPRRTVFTAIGPDGRTLAGWPRGSTGFASSPVVDADGTVYYVSATSKVYAHDRAGEVKAGWPMAARGAAHGCGGGESPDLAPDGTIFVVGDEVTALSTDGHLLPGWPYRPTGDLVEPCLTRTAMPATGLRRSDPTARSTWSSTRPPAPAFGRRSSPSIDGGSRSRDGPIACPWMPRPSRSPRPPLPRRTARRVKHVFPVRAHGNR